MPKLELKMPKPKLNFPLKLKKEEEEEEEVWPFKKTICETLEEAVKEHPYLASYLESLTEKPTYMLSSNLEKYEGGNVMYPLGLGIYAHIYVGGEIGKYNLVEPEKPNRELLDNVEVAVATLVKDKEYSGQKEKVLASFFKQAIKKKLVKIPKGLDENNILYFFLREKVGHGFLDGFLADPWLEDISIPGQGKVFVYHKMFGHLETNVEVSKGEIDRLLRSIAERYGKVLSYTHPIIDIHLPDGSVDSDEPTIYREEKTGRVKITKIGELVDGFYKGKSADTPIKVKGIQIPTFNLKTLKIEWKPVSYVYRKRWREELYEVKLETGRTVRLTGNHSIYKLTGDGVKAVRADTLKVGDYVAIPLKIPPQHRPITEIDLIKEFCKRNWKYTLFLKGDIPERMYELYKDKLVKLYRGIYKNPRVMVLSHKYRRLWPLELYECLPREVLNKCVIQCRNSKAAVKPILKVSEELMRLLGYYIAEGFLLSHKNMYGVVLCFGSHETDLIEDSVECLKRLFEVSPCILNLGNQCKVVAYGYLIWFVFKNILKVSEYAKKKCVPEIVFNVQENLAREFIKAWWRGDYGYSASKRLISDVLYLSLLSGNIISYSERIKEANLNGRKIKSRAFYIQHLDEKDRVEYPYMIPLETFSRFRRGLSCPYDRNKRISKLRATKLLNKPGLKEVLALKEEVGRTRWKTAFLWRRIGYLNNGKLTAEGKEAVKEAEFIKSLIKGEIGFVKIVKIKKVTPTNGFVYDLSVEGNENFIAGFGGVFCHNSRFNIVYGEDISLKGSNFTIRKFPEEPISVAHLIKWGTLSPELAAYLWMLFDVGVSAFVCGETASGKTTTLNALACFINSDSKIISIEETPEINIFHKNWIREVTRIHTGAQVTMFDLLKAALRQRPDYIIVGEIRGEEGRVAFQAIETGHPVLSTMHAGTLGQLFQRLTSHPIDVPKTHIDGLNLAIFQARMERGKKFIRRVTSINEIIGYEPDEARLNYLPTFIYDSDMDNLRFMGSSFHLETKVLTFRGWGKERLRELYDEMKARAEILSFLSENFPKYTDVWKTVIEVRNKGVWEVYRKVKEGQVPWK